ncbi:MAG: glucose 1-dehydrogenase [Chloroflexi bacterium]|nr:glucose 1-dehydrogenase [Chloroflexota bacterium]
MKLADKVALVTGSATGIGRAIALALASEGADIVVNYSKSQAEADATAAAVRELGRRAAVIRADVGQMAEIRALVEAAVVELGRIDMLVNNAGFTVFVPFADLDGVSEADWDRIFAVNLRGQFFCAQAVAPIMRRQGSGCIINVASTAGLRASGSSIPYACSKAGVVMLTACLARALAPQIRVNALAPGLADTRWNAGAPPGAWDGRIEATPLKRIAKPQDVAQAALFLAASADFITGQTIVVDGGWGI